MSEQITKFNPKNLFRSDDDDKAEPSKRKISTTPKHHHKQMGSVGEQIE